MAFQRWTRYVSKSSEHIEICELMYQEAQKGAFTSWIWIDETPCLETFDGEKGVDFPESARDKWPCIRVWEVHYSGKNIEVQNWISTFLSSIELERLSEKSKLWDFYRDIYQGSIQFSKRKHGWSEAYTKIHFKALAEERFPECEVLIRYII